MAAETIYGANAVREALSAGRQLNRVYLAKESRTRHWEEIVEAAKAAGVPYDFVPQAKLNALTGVREHQGVAAVAAPVQYLELEAWLRNAPPDAVLLALDQVQHPKNLGMLIRTALAAGVHGVLFPTRGGALVDDAVLRASAGTAQKLPLVTTHNLAQALRKLRQENFWVYGMAGEGDQQVFELSWPARIVLVMGNETKGLRPVTRKQCDALLRIPISDAVESLNVAMAAGIALFDVRRQRLAEKKNAS